MKEVKSPKKPLVYYYGIVILVLFLFNLFVSPVLDMKKLISNMMKWANVSEARLKKSLLLLLPLCKHFLGSIGNTLQITLLQNGKYRPKYYMERMTI